MLDPTTYMLLHKLHRRELMKQADDARLLQIISRPATQLLALSELSRQISNWWSHRHQKVQEDRVADTKVAMP